MKFEKRQTIEFKHPSILSDIPMILTGIVVGHGKEVRKMWPIEMENVPDDYLLVWRKDVYGNEEHYAVDPQDVIQEGVVINAK